MSRLPLPLTGLIVLALHVPTRAADSPPEAAFIEDLPVVLTPSRLARPQHEAPAAVTVIDRDTIRATGYRDLARLLRLVPGIQAGQERASTQWVTYHGLGNNFPSEMQVLIDGRSVISPSSFGGVDWNALPITLEEIERIEVVRGTDPVAYGANAFLGVVNIITRHSAVQPGFKLSAAAGDHGIADSGFEWSGTHGPLSLRVNARYARDDGFRDLNDESEATTAILRADLQLGPQDELMLRLGVASDQRGDGFADSLFGYNAERDWESRNDVLHLVWRHTPSAGEELALSYYRNSDHVRDSWLASADPALFPFPPVFAPAVPLDRDRDSVRDNLELEHQLRLSAVSHLVWGLEVRHEEVDAPFLFQSGNPPALDLYRLFGNYEWRVLQPLLLNFGLLWEKQTRQQANLAPRLFANWQADDGHTLRAGFSRAYQQLNQFVWYGDIRAVDPPTGALLVQPYVANPELDLTRVDSTELGYLGRFATWDSTVDVRVFQEKVHGFIVRVPGASTDQTPLLGGYLPASRYENLPRPITLRGVEYQLRTHPRPGSEVWLAHSLLEADYGNSGVDSRVAPYTVTLSWLQRWGGGWSSTLTLLRSGPMAGGDGFVATGFEYLTPAYTTVDARLAWSGQIGGSPVEIALNGINLGERHQEFADRSLQRVLGDEPANPVSPLVWLSASIGF